MRVAVLMTCYNRAETTLECLQHLFAQKLQGNLSFDVWLNDDASPDRTGDKIRVAYPRVNVVKGSGHDFWCGGMRRVWSAAVSSGRAYDGYFWLNDDTMLFDYGLGEMLVENGSIIVGATYNEECSKITYSGRDEMGRKLVPNGKLQTCHWMNGNAVFIPQSVFMALGNFPSYMTHGIGDYDYGLRAKKIGVNILLATRPVGICKEKIAVEKWKNPKMPLVERLKNLYSPSGGPEPHIFFRYNLTHFGVVRAIRLFVGQHFKMMFPCRAMGYHSNDAAKSSM